MLNLTHTKTDDTLLFSMDGKIDSTNSRDFEKDLFDIVNENANTFSNIVIDAEKLTFISSAGLRVILRLRKSHANLRIINVDREIYDIFDMTGFTEMMQIEKAYRRISVDGCEIIGEGAMGIVYRISPDTIVKFYRPGTDLESIHRERELSRKAFILGVPTAIPYDVVKVNDGYGAVFELLNADTLRNVILDHPDLIDEYVKQSVEILKKMHTTEVDPADLPDRKEEGMKWVKRAMPHLPQDVAEKLYAFFDAIPTSNYMMHCDFHIKNIMVQNGELLLIDMDTISRGDKIFEFSGLYDAYVGYSDLDHNNSMEFFKVPYETTKYLWDETLKLYFSDKTPSEIAEIEKQIQLVSYTRFFGAAIEDGEPEEVVNYYKGRVLELV